MWAAAGLLARVSLMKHEYPLEWHSYLLYGDGSLCMNRKDSEILLFLGQQLVYDTMEYASCF